MTDIVISGGGTRSDVNIMASADQVTILGNGTSEFPLRAEDAVDLRVLFVNPFADPDEPRVGNPVVAVDDVTPVGLEAVVRTGSAGLGSPQLPQIIGVVVRVDDLEASGVPVTMRTSGSVTLSASEWEQITGDGGGLSPGSPYYLDWAFNSFGRLTPVPPTTSGMAVVQVGIAISATTLVLSLPAVPVLVP